MHNTEPEQLAPNAAPDTIADFDHFRVDDTKTRVLARERA